MFAGLRQIDGVADSGGELSAGVAAAQVAKQGNGGKEADTRETTKTVHNA
jgi:hypothetical protein